MFMLMVELYRIYLAFYHDRSIEPTACEHRTRSMAHGTYRGVDGAHRGGRSGDTQLARITANVAA